MSVRHETKFLWCINKDGQILYEKTENDLAEDACMCGMNEDENVIVFDSEPTESMAHKIAENTLSLIQNDKLLPVNPKWKRLTSEEG